MKKYLAEVLGTFGLVFAGTGAIVINDFSQGAITHVGICLTFGLVVMAMIYSVGDISGAHLNPAVTIGFWVAKRFPAKEILPYILSQLVGAFLASGLLWFVFPEHPNLGATLPSLTLVQTFVFEIILTFFLMFVIINVSTGAKEKGLMAGVAIGATVALEALFAGPVTGASMNPARSLAPALVSGELTGFWIYIVAPIIGAYLAILGCKGVQKECCCCTENEALCE